MNKNISATEHYRNQRDLLAYYLLKDVGISKARMGKILGIGRAAVSLQFPTKGVK